MKILLAFFLLFPSLAGAQDRSPYDLNWVNGPALLGGAIALSVAAAVVDDSVRPPTAAQIANLRQSDINDFDYFAINFSSRRVSQMSDALVVAALASPIIMTFAEAPMRRDMWTLGVMYFETGLLASFLPSFGKGTVVRYRPYAYNPSTPPDILYSNETRRSFFSGHACWAFASMTFLSTVYSDYYPESEYKSAVWWTSMTAATTISVMRILAGAHYPTDVLTGAAVGFGIGYMIPWLHRASPMRVGFHSTRDGGVEVGISSVLIP